MTIPAEPEPRVSVAKSEKRSAAVVSSDCSRANVRSWTVRLPSPSTISAYSICPDSIIIAASCIPLTKPRHALDRSKFRQDVGSPSSWWTATAADGSSRARHTDVSIRRPICSGAMPASASARAPAWAAASVNETPSGHHRRSSIPASC